MPSLGDTAEPLWQSSFSLTVGVLKISEAQNTSWTAQISTGPFAAYSDYEKTQT